MKLLNKLITKSAIYKHLNELYEQALKDVEVLQDNARKDCKDIQKLQKMLGEAESDNIKYFKIIKKIRARVNKLDKKDENVKEIIIENEGYTVEQLVNAYNYGNISDDLFKYGLSLLGFKTSEVL